MRYQVTRFLAVLGLIGTFLYCPFPASAQEPALLGVLEDHKPYQQQSFRTVRVIFEKTGDQWQSVGECQGEDCLAQTTKQLPTQLTWTISFDGRKLGTISTESADHRKISEVGEQSITSPGIVPTIGKPSIEFGGQTDRSVLRPLIANSQPYFTDPELWKLASPAPELVKALREAFRKHFPKLCRTSKADESKLEAFPYNNESVAIARTYVSKTTGWAVAQLHLEAIDCEDTEAGFDIYDPWFAVAPGGKGSYLESGMWLVDAGDYDNDGKSELVFSIDQYNRGGYRIFYDNFSKRATLKFGYH